MREDTRETGKKLRYVLPSLHLALCVSTAAGIMESEGSWAWFLVFLVDFPLSILLLPMLRIAHPLLVFGVVGTAWWYWIGRFAIYLFVRGRAYLRR